MCGIVGYVGDTRVRRPSSSRACASSSTAATTRPASRCSNGKGDDAAVVRCRGKLRNLENAAEARAAARARSASATRAGPPTAGPPTRTRTRTRSARVVGGPQRHHREPPRAARGARRRRAQVLVRDRHRDLRAPRSTSELQGRRARPDRGGARARSRRSQGAYAIVVHVATSEPDALVAAKNASPLVLGLGDGENFVASDIPAILAHTREMVFLEDGEIAERHARPASR